MILCKQEGAFLYADAEPLEGFRLSYKLYGGSRRRMFFLNGVTELFLLWQEEMPPWLSLSKIFKTILSSHSSI